MKISFLILTSFLLSNFCFGQNIYAYFDKDWKKCESKDAQFYRTVSRDGDNYLVTDYYKNKKPQMIAVCSAIEPNLVYNGKLTRYNEKGLLIEISNYTNGVKYGLYMRTKPSGEDTTFAVHYLDGNFSYEYKNVFLAKFGSVAPQYVGGSAAIAKVITKNLHYPEKSKAEKVGGRLDVHFIVDTLGKVSNVKISKGINTELDEEAIRLVKLLGNGNWLPATKAEKKISVAYSIPIYFFPDEEYEKEYKDKEAKKYTYQAFFDMNRAIVDSNAATFYTIYSGDDEKYNSGTNETYLMTGILLSKEEHHFNEKGERVGVMTYYFDDGKVRSLYHFINEKKSGEFIQYYSNGKKEREESYHLDSLVNGNCYTRSGMDTLYYARSDKFAQFPGGEGAFNSFVYNTLKYPKKAKRRRLSGIVDVKFIVDKYGNIRDIKVDSMVNPIFAKEALRIFGLMPKWEPGYMIDQATSVIYTYPLNFLLK